MSQTSVRDIKADLQKVTEAPHGKSNVGDNKLVFV